MDETLILVVSKGQNRLGVGRAGEEELMAGRSE